MTNFRAFLQMKQEEREARRFYEALGELKVTEIEESKVPGYCWVSIASKHKSKDIFMYSASLFVPLSIGEKTRIGQTVKVQITFEIDAHEQPAA